MPGTGRSPDQAQSQVPKIDDPAATTDEFALAIHYDAQVALIRFAAREAGHAFLRRFDSYIRALVNPSFGGVDRRLLSRGALSSPPQAQKNASVRISMLSRGRASGGTVGSWKAV